MNTLIKEINYRNDDIWLTVEILPDIINYKAWELNHFEWQIIKIENIDVGCISFGKDTSEKNAIYVDKIEIHKDKIWKWYWKMVIDTIFQYFDVINIASTDDAISFWLRIGAEDLGRTAMVGDRSMRLEKQDFYDTINWKIPQKEKKIFYTLPYNQDNDIIENNSSLLYQSIWNDNKLPLGTKLYIPLTDEYESYFELPVAEKFTRNIFTFINTGWEYVVANPDWKITRYSNVKYEEWFYDFEPKSNHIVSIKEEFAMANYDWLVSGNWIIIYN